MDESPTDLVGKEFIFEYGIDRILPPSDKTGGVFATEQRAYRRERVVRCRDCTKSEPRGRRLYCKAPMGHVGYAEVCEDDFCSCGEPREEA